jgi:hypothetical protein
MLSRKLHAHDVTTCCQLTSQSAPYMQHMLNRCSPVARQHARCGRTGGLHWEQDEPLGVLWEVLWEVRAFDGQWVERQQPLRGSSAWSSWLGCCGLASAVGREEASLGSCSLRRA